MLHLCFSGVGTVVFRLKSNYFIILHFFGPIIEGLTLTHNNLLFLVLVMLEETESIPLGIHFPIAFPVLPAFIPLLFISIPLLGITFMLVVLYFGLHCFHFFLPVHQRLLFRFWSNHSGFRLQKLQVFGFWEKNMHFVLEKLLVSRLGFRHSYFTFE